jgi:UDP-3-O-[3-hydroxymyristoyl] glucosamine N-acyltransferase
VVGADCKIDPGTVIGGDGFGFERDERGHLVNFPHVGGVRIGDGVDIGANACIDRGTFGDTIIEDGARIDNLAHISHNVRIGAHAVVVTQTTICGSVEIGRGAWVSPNASVLNQCKVGAGAVVGMGAVVIADVPEGVVVAGNPARPVR